MLCVLNPIQCIFPTKWKIPPIAPLRSKERPITSLLFPNMSWDPIKPIKQIAKNLNLRGAPKKCSRKYIGGHICPPPTLSVHKKYPTLNRVNCHFCLWYSVLTGGLRKIELVKIKTGSPKTDYFKVFIFIC